MRLHLLVSLLIIPLLLSAQDNQGEFRRYTFSGMILAKKSFFYQKDALENSGNYYRLRSKIQPAVQANLNAKLSGKLSFNAGLHIALSGYSVNYKYHTAAVQYEDRLQLRILTYKIPLTLQYDIDNSISLAAGVGLNHHRYLSDNYQSSLSTIDLFAVKSYINAPFINPTTVSGQLLLQLKLSGRSSLVLQYDIDFGKYPGLDFSHDIDHISNKTTTRTKFSGNPRLHYVAVGYNFKVLN